MRRCMGPVKTPVLDSSGRLCLESEIPRFPNGHRNGEVVFLRHAVACPAPRPTGGEACFRCQSIFGRRLTTRSPSPDEIESVTRQVLVTCNSGVHYRCGLTFPCGERARFTSAWPRQDVSPSIQPIAAPRCGECSVHVKARLISRQGLRWLDSQRRIGFLAANTTQHAQPLRHLSRST